MYRLASKIVLLLFLIATSFSSYGQPFTKVDHLVGLDKVSDNNGVAIADFDQDGFLDIFFVGYHSFNPTADSTWNKLMRNRGDGTFEDVTIQAGFTSQFSNSDITASLGEKMAASWGDYDNDGFPDLFLSNSREDQLYHNNGDGTFEDVTEEAGVKGCYECYSGGGLWFDHDRDGDLDLYVSILNGDNILYENLGNGTFEDVTQFYRLEGKGVTWTSVALDIGKDGLLDIYSANDTQINECFENRSGVHYNEVSRAYRVADQGAGMGIAVGDYNNDGFFDVYVTNIFNHFPNPLFKNSGQRRYLNVADRYGVSNTGWGWGVQFFDYDHDGDEDLFAVNGVVSKQAVNGLEQQDEGHYFYKNTLIENTKEGFVDWSEASRMNDFQRARGLEVFDYDKDGDLDVLIANVESTPSLYRNETISLEEKNNSFNWIQIELEGTLSNKSAFGTEVKITCGEQSYYRWHHGTSFFAQSIKPIHFGIGSSPKIDEIQVRWLSGEIQTLKNIPANQKIKITEAGIVSSSRQLETTNVQVKVAPNPFTEKVDFVIKTPLKMKSQLRIYDLHGQLIHQSKQSLNANSEEYLSWQPNSDLAAGVYYYHLINEHQLLYSGKIIKQ
ncbi:MAG: hypothetical protein Sapg2KO_28230 [Saprospiraceae bacterium]